MGRSPSHHGLLILASLAAIPSDDERHGYAIKKDIERRTSDDVRLGSTTLYRLLAQLLDEGLVAERTSATGDDDPRRRYYRITPAGREALRSSGFAPPMTIGSTFSGDSLTVLPIATCPYCASRNTSLENAFGPTLCRAIYHCGDCRQPFEAFKPI